MNLERLSAIEIGKLVNSKAVSPKEVIQYFANRIEKRNPSINAYVYTMIEDALEEARHLEFEIMMGETSKPFAGVPVGLKDFLPSKKGWANSHGGVPALVATDDHDSAFYSAVKSAGAIAIGKTNAPPFGFSGACDNTMYGPTLNPFDLARNSGGSSGGSAAAVADGLSPICEGGDAGGSIRIPSSWCGCYGFKAGIGTVPSYCRPDGWSATHPYCFGGGITRTVEDSAVLLNYMAQYDPRDPLSLPINSKKDFTQLMRRNIRGMRVALTYDFNLFDTDSEVKESITKMAQLLEDLGAEIDLVDFNFHHTLEEFAEMWGYSISIDTALDIASWKNDGLDLIKDYGEQLTPEFIFCNERASRFGIQDMRKFNEMRTDILDAHEDIFFSHDVILSPVSAVLPINNKDAQFKFGHQDMDKSCMKNIIGFGETFLVNFVGYPAASVPSTPTKSGIPIGAQIIGKKYREEDVLAVSWAIEQAQPWSYDKPFARM